MGSMKCSPLQHEDRVLTPKDLNCLQDDISAMDQCVKQVMKSDGVNLDDLANYGADDCDDNKTFESSKSVLVLNKEELQQESGSLTQQYISLTDHLRNIPKGMFEPGVDQNSSVLTPRRMLALSNGCPQGNCFNKFGCSDGGSPDHSSQAGAESFSSLSPVVDADSECEFSSSTYLPHVMNDDSECLHIGETASETLIVGWKGMLEVANEAQGGSGDVTLMGKEYDDYYVLLDGAANYERALNMANQKLRSSQEEIAKLKQEHAKKAFVIDPSQDLGMKLELLCPGYNDFKNKKTKVGKLLKRVAELECLVMDYDQKNVALEEDLGQTRKMLEDSKEETGKMKRELRDELERKWLGRLEVASHNICTLKAELLSERRLVSELQETISMYKSSSANQGHEITELKSALAAAQEAFNSEKSQFISEISFLFQQHSLLQGTLKEAELRAESMRSEVEGHKSEKMEMIISHGEQEKHLLAEIERLKGQLSQSSEIVNALNMSLDVNKQKFDMLVVERDELIANIQTLNAERRCQDIQIEDMRAQLNQLTSEHREMANDLEAAQKLSKGLKTRVVELEIESEKERDVSSERAKEKLEAIRQLCLTIEYYRREYHELREALVGLKHFRLVPS